MHLMKHLIALDFQRQGGPYEGPGVRRRYTSQR